MTESVRHDCEALLTHAGWVRALARHLTADAHAADDVAQDALALALTRRAPLDQPARSWLAGVVRNLARRSSRERGNRAARERAVARADVDASNAQLLEQLDSHRAVVEAVARLDEPYRSAVLLRYFEDLSPAEIAARTSTPLRTVHTRLHRALARLRADLDRAHGGDGRTWLLALLPFAAGSKRWSAAAFGALVMDVKLKIALAAALVVGVCSTLVLWPDDSGGVSPAAIAASSHAVDSIEPSRGAEPAIDAPLVAERRAPESSRAEPAPAPAVAPPAKVSGRVIDVDRAPVASVVVRYDDPERGASDGREATTDASGRFELDVPDDRGHVDVASAGWTSVFRPDLQAGAAARELVLVVARSVTLTGIVVDEARRPIESASLVVVLPFGLRARFDSILDRSSTIERSAKSDAHGRFVLEGAPRVADAQLVTTRAPYVTDERSLPDQDAGALEIVLRRASATPTRVAGRVVDLAGDPVEDAWVGLGSASTKSGASGAFAFDLASRDDAALRADDGGEPRLHALKKGYLPSETVGPVEGVWPDPLILRLGGPPLSIEGRVFDSAGKPVAGAEVWTTDETRFGFVPIEGGESAMRAGANVEGLLRGDPWSRQLRTDADGRFELTGLLPHDYRIDAIDKRRLLTATAVFSAGARGVELRIPKEDVHERVAGRVTSLAGAPLEGFHVVLARRTEDTRGPESRRFETVAAKTGADGRFVFEGVSRTVNTLIVRGAEVGLGGIERPIGTQDEVERLEIAVPLRVHAQVEAVDASEFEKIAILDARGETLELSVHHGKSAYGMREVRMHDGRSEPFSVSELATTIVLRKGDAEVRRAPLKLARGELNTIRP